MSRWRFLAVVPLFVGGCATVSLDLYDGARAPACEYRGRPGAPMIVLAAQAVPSATLIPCVRLLPAGWTVRTVAIERGTASFALDSDRAGPRAVTVTLTRFCTLPAVTRVPTDEPGTRRFEEVGPVRNGVGFTGTRYYLFPGGCVTYTLKFAGEERAEPIGETDDAISFITRDDVRDRVREDTNGRAELDP